MKMKKSTFFSSNNHFSCEAFSLNDNLSEIEFSKYSNLKIIHNDIFKDTKITSITIPSNIIELKENWCRNKLDLTVNVMKILKKKKKN